MVSWELPRNLDSVTAHCVDDSKLQRMNRCGQFLRFLVFITFALWQGGFAFYGGFVVPIGAKILGSDTQQGFITQSVTIRLNGIGVICIVLCAAALCIAPADRPKLRWGLWSILAITLLLLIYIHRLMDSYLDFEQLDVRNSTAFHYWHRIYLSLSTLQWFASLVLIWELLRPNLSMDVAARHRMFLAPSESSSSPAKTK